MIRGDTRSLDYSSLRFRVLGLGFRAWSPSTITVGADCKKSQTLNPKLGTGDPDLLVLDEAGIVHPVQVFCGFEVAFARQGLDLASVGPSGNHALLAKPGAALFGCCPSYFCHFAAMKYHVQPAIAELQNPVLLLWATVR